MVHWIYQVHRGFPGSTEFTVTEILEHNMSNFPFNFPHLLVPTCVPPFSTCSSPRHCGKHLLSPRLLFLRGWMLFTRHLPNWKFQYKGFRQVILEPGVRHSRNRKLGENPVLLKSLTELTPGWRLGPCISHFNPPKQKAQEEIVTEPSLKGGKNSFCAWAGPIGAGRTSCDWTKSDILFKVEF